MKRKAQDALKAAQPEMHRSVSKGIFKKILCLENYQDYLIIKLLK